MGWNQSILKSRGEVFFWGGFGIKFLICAIRDEQRWLVVVTKSGGSSSVAVCRHFLWFALAVSSVSPAPSTIRTFSLSTPGRRFYATLFPSPDMATSRDDLSSLLCLPDWHWSHMTEAILRSIWHQCHRSYAPPMEKLTVEAEMCATRVAPHIWTQWIFKKHAFLPLLARC